MTIFTIGRYISTLIAAAVLLAGCGGSQPALPPARANPDQSETPLIQAYHVVHEFGEAAGDGTNPRAEVIVVKGTLYGTTFSGGTNNDGTVFALTKSGQEKVLHSFGASGDGSQPAARLVADNGTLYGTTVEGGANNSGAIFSVTRSGEEKVLYSFPFSANAGAQPWAGLIDVNGALYGTTYQGGDDSCGSGGCGSVFSITPAGSEKLLYSFGTHAGDGVNPLAALIDVDGVLYGTTAYGGEYKRGTVFAISKAGKERIVYNFGKS
ncbi:MAG TPA: choice-of-anchor tandem repeat GloVer-containing protein, partial [Candidatus Acidoferrum sp.]|nr:choice-of-anchor tandem repeat GloVer-containing protein [Candidatus Acidoferrum sp.]